MAKKFGCYQIDHEGSQILNIEEAQILSKLDSDVKFVKGMTIGPFETVEAKRVLKKAPNHYKAINIVVNDLGEGQHLKLKRGTSVAHVEASQVVPPLDSSIVQEDMCEKVTRDIPKENQLEDSSEKNDERLSKILEKLDLEGIESWTEQQQCSVRKLLEEYQQLFALNLRELGKTSLVQHEIQLSDKTPFKERYRRIPPHQYEEVRKHLQEMLDIGAICRSTSPWASPVVLVCKKDGSLWFCIDLKKLNNQTIKEFT